MPVKHPLQGPSGMSHEESREYLATPGAQG